METEVETGGRWPPAQGWTPGAPSPGMDAQSHQPRDGCPEPPEAGRGWEGASGQRSALGHPDLRHLVSRTGGRWTVGCQDWERMDSHGFKPINEKAVLA